MTQAEKAFFFEYLEKYPSRPRSAPEARKYDLAYNVWQYIKMLADRDLPLADLYVTNLCNEFLPPTPGNGTVLIPDQSAAAGVEAIREIISQGHFRLILPMSQQTFYHLCRLNILDQVDERIERFKRDAQPSPRKAALGVYVSKGKAPFLEVCGQRFNHCGIPVVSVLHVKQWPLKARAIRYTAPMDSAKREVKEVLVRS